MNTLNLYCVETGSLVHVVEEAATTDESTVKAFERHYSEYFAKPLFAEIGE